MHELGITQNIVAIVSERAGDQKICRVKLEIGKLSAIMPDAIRFCFELCAKDTALDGAVLEIDEVEGRGKCNLCGEEMPLTLLAGVCRCGCRDVVCVAGKELMIKEMEVV